MTTSTITDQKIVDPAVVIDRLAEEHGISRQDVLKFPKLFKGTGIDPSKVDESDANRAERIHRNEMSNIIKKHNASPFRQPNELVEPERTVRKVGDRQKIFDHPVTAVIRWMGSEEWTLDRAKKVLTKLGVEVSDGTIRNQLRSGRDSDDGVAKLSLKNIKELAKLAKEG